MAKERTETLEEFQVGRDDSRKRGREPQRKESGGERYRKHVRVNQADSDYGSVMDLKEVEGLEQDQHVSIAKEIIDILDRHISTDAAFNDMRRFALKTIESEKNDDLPVAQKQAVIKKIIETIHARRPQIPLELPDRDIVKLHNALAGYQANLSKGNSASAIAGQFVQHEEVLLFDSGRMLSLRPQIGKKHTVQEARRVVENELNSVLPSGSYLNDQRKRLVEITMAVGGSVKDWLMRDAEIAEEKKDAREHVLNASNDFKESFRSGGSAEDLDLAKQRLAGASDGVNKWRPNRYHYARKEAKQSIKATLQWARTSLSRSGAPVPMTPRDIETVARLIGEYKQTSGMTARGVPHALLDAVTQKTQRPGLGRHQPPSSAIAHPTIAVALTSAPGQKDSIESNSISRPVKNLKKAQPAKFVRDAVRDKGQTSVTSYFSLQAKAVAADIGRSTMQSNNRVAEKIKGQTSAQDDAKTEKDFGNKPDQERRGSVLRQRDHARGRSG